MGAVKYENTVCSSLDFDALVGGSDHMSDPNLGLCKKKTYAVESMAPYFHILPMDYFAPAAVADPRPTVSSL
jgi:hypothetical protein